MASKKMKIARLYARSGSLKDFLSVRPLWWTSKAKAKAIEVAGIVLGMNFLHSFKLIHGGLKSSNILFDEYHRIRIANFGKIDLIHVKVLLFVPELGLSLWHVKMQSSEEYTLKIDIFSFVLILFEIVVSLPALRKTRPSKILRSRR
jgi:serine/threonine protein kinase